MFIKKIQEKKIWLWITCPPEQEAAQHVAVSNNKRPASSEPSDVLSPSKVAKRVLQGEKWDGKKGNQKQTFVTLLFY